MPIASSRALVSSVTAKPSAVRRAAFRTDGFDSPQRRAVLRRTSYARPRAEKSRQNAVGAVPGPMDCFLILRGLKTLHLRMDRHAENAAALVEFLEKHPKVESLIYPFRESHPQHKIARHQMKNGGGMISFIMKDGREAAIKVAEGTKIFTLAESLGGVESLIEVPAAMTHLSVAGSQLDVDAALVRLSVGIENKDDLIEDIKQALEQA